MNTYQCENCKFDFKASEAVSCPRCSSKKLVEKKDKPISSAPAAASKAAEPTQAKQSPYYSAQVLGDTKQAWIAQQTNELRACPDCGGVEFEINWRRREKVCKKCGSIFGFKRNH